MCNGIGVAATDNLNYTSINQYNSPQFDENGNLVYFIISNDKHYTHMTMSAVTIDDTSIITINEPIEEEAPDTSYTNVLKTAEAYDSTAVYNGKGWKENTRWSTSSNAEKEYQGIYLSGYIPVTWNDTVRMKNINLKDGVSENHIAYFETKGTQAFKRTPSECKNVKLDSNGNLIEFTADMTGFIRVSCSGIDETSIITINEPIDGGGT